VALPFEVVGVMGADESDAADELATGAFATTG